MSEEKVADYDAFMIGWGHAVRGLDSREERYKATPTVVTVYKQGYAEGAQAKKNAEAKAGSLSAT